MATTGPKFTISEYEEMVVNAVRNSVSYLELEYERVMREDENATPQDVADALEVWQQHEHLLRQLLLASVMVKVVVR